MIAVGCDHAGFELKKRILKFLDSEGYEAKDFGTFSTESTDYPDIAGEIAGAVAKGEYERGILICGAGIGMSIAANKVPGIRAACCTDSYTARLAKEHNDANILTLGGRIVGPELGVEITKAWLQAEFQGGRHQARIDKISEIERKYYGR